MDISVVVPTYNRKSKLEKCLDSLLRQDCSLENFEIIVVDDGSTDETREMMSGLLKAHPNLKYFLQLHKGPSAARNLGVKYSAGSIVGFIDDDCVVEGDWVRLMLGTHRLYPGISAVGGLTLVSNARSPVLVSQFLSNCSIEININSRREVIFFPTCNVSLKRYIFDTYRFDDIFPLPGGEDLEFFWKLFKEGHKFIWNKDIKVTHNRDDSIAGFIRQAYIYGQGNLLTQYLHKDQPLLKELKIGLVSFWVATMINILKIQRFSYLLGRRLIVEQNIRNIHKQSSIFAYFFLHKTFYIAGNIMEFMRICRKKFDKGTTKCYLPRLLVLDITHSCNLQCSICDIWKTAKTEKDISIELVKDLLSQAKELEIKEIALSGGEVLLRKDIFDIIAHAAKLGIKDLGLLSNGILVKAYIERLKPYLTGNTVSLVISLDSLNPELHNRIRNYSLAWQETIEGLKMLSDLKKRHPGLVFNIITIILNQNLEELTDLADFARSLGASSLQFQPLLPNNLNMTERKRSVFWIPKERLPVLDSTVDRLIDFKLWNANFIHNSASNLSLIKKYYRGMLTSADVKCVSAYKTILTSNQGNYSTCFGSYGDMRKDTLEGVLKDEQIILARERVQECSWPCLLPCFCD